MTQVLHILKKDIRHLAGEIAVLFAACAVLAWDETRFLGFGIRGPQFYALLLFAAGTHLIARVVHAEAIPDDRQFWLTRPYDWKLLLAAKLLFIFLFVNVPLSLTVFAILKIFGFSTTAILPSLLVWQILTFLVWEVPVAALAAVTQGTASFAAGLILLAGSVTVVAPLLSNYAWPDQAEVVAWVWNGAVSLVVATGAVAILYVQYKHHRTGISRAGIGLVSALSVAIVGVVPTSLALNLQARLSPENVDHSSMHVSLAPATSKARGLRESLNMRVRGIPAGMEGRVEWTTGKVVDSTGKVRYSWQRPAGGFHAGTLGLDTSIAPEVARELRGMPVTLQGSMYVTLFGSPKVVRISETPFTAWKLAQPALPIVVAPGLVCVRPFCWRMFGEAGGVVSLRAANGEAVSWSEPPQESPYTPFPRLTLDVVNERFNSYDADHYFWPPATELIYLKPLSHFWLDFEIPVERFLE